jgi:hypothetical protein
MDSLKERLDREVEGLPISSEALAKTIACARRRSRNGRIAAGIVGIAVFVGLVWIVTSGLSFDRTPTPAVPGPAETGPAETAPPPAPASAAPDVVRRGECHPAQPEGVPRLELFDLGDRIRVRFGLLTMGGNPWRVVLRHTHIPAISPPEVVFRGTERARNNIPAWFRIIRHVTDLVGVDEFQAKAVDTQTDQVCRVNARI